MPGFPNPRAEASASSITPIVRLTNLVSEQKQLTSQRQIFVSNMMEVPQKTMKQDQTETGCRADPPQGLRTEDEGS